MASIAFWQGKCYSPLDFNYNFYLDMVALRQLKTGFVAAVGAAAVFVTPAFAQDRADNPANADAEERLTCALSDESFNPTVPVEEAISPETGEWFPQDVVRTGTARRSRKGVVLAVYGNDPSVLAASNRAVHDGRACGDDLPVPVRGIVRGSPHDPAGVDVYSAGARTATYTAELIQQARDSNLNLHEAFLSSIERAAHLHSSLVLGSSSAAASGEQVGDARVIRASNQPASGLD